LAIKLKLHEQDERQLLKIRRELVGWHHVTPGATQKSIGAALGRTDSFLHNLETGDSHPRLSSLQLWGSFFDLRLQPRFHMPDAVVDPENFPKLVAETEMMQTMASPFDAASWVRLWIVTELTLYRHEQGLSTEDVASRLGLTTSAVNTWERKGHDPLISKVFTYARAVGGYVTFDLIERCDWPR
jgi:transcriptional regulator with XRE-family HTH domain